jgi:hypothetical protein
MFSPLHCRDENGRVHSLVGLRALAISGVPFKAGTIMPRYYASVVVKKIVLGLLGFRLEL